MPQVQRVFILLSFSYIQCQRYPSLDSICWLRLKHDSTRIKGFDSILTAWQTKHG